MNMSRVQKDVLLKGNALTHFAKTKKDYFWMFVVLALVFWTFYVLLALMDTCKTTKATTYDIPMGVNNNAFYIIEDAFYVPSGIAEEYQFGRTRITNSACVIVKESE